MIHWHWRWIRGIRDRGDLLYLFRNALLYVVNIKVEGGFDVVMRHFEFAEEGCKVA